jgi:hypothetical protein
MAPLLTEFTAWITKLPEPVGLLLLGAVLISMASRRRHVPAGEIAPPTPTSKVVRRRIPSSTGLTAQRGHS